MTKSKWRRVEWRRVFWLNTSARQELAECAEYAPDIFHVDRLEVPVEGLKERLERLDDGRAKS